MIIPQMTAQHNSSLDRGAILRSSTCSFYTFIRLSLHPCVYRDPVYFPGLAPIIRERLFKTARIRSDVRNNKSNKDGSTIECFLVEELPASIFELPYRGLAHGTAAAVGEI